LGETSRFLFLTRDQPLVSERQVEWKWWQSPAFHGRGVKGGVRLTVSKSDEAGGVIFTRAVRLGVERKWHEDYKGVSRMTVWK